MTKEAVEKAANLSCFRNPTNIETLGGGITNINLLVRDGESRFVVRLGEDIREHGVMRWNEYVLSQAANKLGISPTVVHHEPGVLVLEFIDAKTFTEEDVRSDKNLPRIVDLIAKAHREIGQHLKSPVISFWPFQVNRTYITQLLAENSTHAAKLPELVKSSQELETAVGKVQLVIAHNDLLAGNILDDGRKLHLIDWEYGGMNSPLFDLAGLAGNNGLSDAQERAMLEQYFDAPAEENWRAFVAMKCVSLMRETLWSMTSEIHSEIDFDYAAYTEDNLERLDTAMSDFNNI